MVDFNKFFKVAIIFARIQNKELVELDFFS